MAMIGLREWFDHVVEGKKLLPAQEKLVDQYAHRVADALESGGLDAVKDTLRELMVASEEAEGEPKDDVEDVKDFEDVKDVEEDRGNERDEGFY
jgi:hypothetical protein